MKKTISNQFVGKDISLHKLHDIFLRKFLLLFVTIFLILGLIVYFWIKDIYIEQTKIDLLNNIDIISLQVDKLENADFIAKKVKKATNLRVTIVSKDGVVLGESDKNYKKMDNHLNRIEILESKYQEYGSIIRYSDTLGKELLYISKKFHNHKKEYYIRMARDIKLINEQFLYLSIKVGLLFLLFMICSFYIALTISKDVQNETKNILDFLKNLTKQRKAISISSTYSSEFNKITKLLTTVSDNLSKQDKQKAKYTAKLKHSNKQKDDIIAAISHEFKNPISVISGYTQTLIEEKEINPNIQNRFLGKIASNSMKLTNMIDRLRLSIKLEEGKQPYIFSKCKLEKLTNTIISDLQVNYPSRKIKFEAKDIIIKADETILSIAITNLIENALKYSEDTVIVQLEENYLSVIDSGIGINEKDIEKITDKFYRVSSNGWNNSLGVGLSIVKNILKIHNFKLEIKSEENAGSIFKIKF